MIPLLIGISFVFLCGSAVERKSFFESVVAAVIAGYFIVSAIGQIN